MVSSAGISRTSRQKTLSSNKWDEEVSLIILNLQVCVIMFCMTKPHSLVLSEHTSLCDMISAYGLGWFLVNIQVCDNGLCDKAPFFCSV
jgi:hypothetical protein